MLTEDQPKRRSPLRNPFLYTGILMLATIVYVGWVLFARWQENRAIERRATEKRRAADERAVEFMGGSRLEIQNFYASPGILHRGESAQLCYGVANAKTIKLEPYDKPVWPSYAHCVNVSPARDTTYTLTIADDKGHTETASFTLKVR
jgi:hypothetical protein